MKALKFIILLVAVCASIWIPRKCSLYDHWDSQSGTSPFERRGVEQAEGKVQVALAAMRWQKETTAPYLESDDCDALVAAMNQLLIDTLLEATISRLAIVLEASKAAVSLGCAHDRQAFREAAFYFKVVCDEVEGVANVLLGSPGGEMSADLLTANRQSGQALHDAATAVAGVVEFVLVADRYAPQAH